ncbi:MAG: hypothetical protein A2234_04530 [Elusimicrobia bacterium RIFOXYA2_FULL_58_8]|nr:MAG: hypothetical protein A2285_03720 [Elusimicrobia bacterium RIFOXYA12_FULL_57_11]OGS15521.1 MAG: hypothetical protein A2234_04530 [Elusimicrobia bacterium RIFOXYA2_FULL_58_8]
MAETNENESLFSAFKVPKRAEPVPLQPQPLQPQPLQPQPLSPAAAPADNSRLLAVEKEVSALRAALAEFKNIAGLAAAPPADDPRLLAVEKELGVLRAALAEARRAAACAAPALAEQLKLAARVDGSEKKMEEFLSRLAAQENNMDSAKVSLMLEEHGKKLAEHEKVFNKAVSAVQPDEVSSLRQDVGRLVAGFEDVKQKFASYAEEFSAVERECRASLGSMKGYVKAAENDPLAGRFDNYLKDSVASLAGKLADAEVSMHAALAGLAGRLNANEALYGRMFTEAEERLKKSLIPEIRQLSDRITAVSSDVGWLKDEYQIVMARKIRALEGKYSAFDAISEHMSVISEEVSSLKNKS